MEKFHSAQGLAGLSPPGQARGPFHKGNPSAVITRPWCSHSSFFLAFFSHELLFCSFLSECLEPASPSFRSFYSHLDVQFLRCFLFQLPVSTCALCPWSLQNLLLNRRVSMKVSFFMCFLDPHLAQPFLSSIVGVPDPICILYHCPRFNAVTHVGRLNQAF